jgi:hypothetical protein
LPRLRHGRTDLAFPFAGVRRLSAGELARKGPTRPEHTADRGLGEVRNVRGTSASVGLERNGCQLIGCSACRVAAAGTGAGRVGSPLHRGLGPDWSSLPGSSQIIIQGEIA